MTIGVPNPLETAYRDAASSNCWKNRPNWFQAQEPITLKQIYGATPRPIGSTTGLPSSPLSTIGIGYNPCAECGSQVDYAVLSDGSVWWSVRNFASPLFGVIGLVLAIPILVVSLVVLVAPAYLGAGVVWLGRAR